jgi:fatty-acid desaturase
MDAGDARNSLPYDGPYPRLAALVEKGLLPDHGASESNIIVVFWVRFVVCGGPFFIALMTRSFSPWLWVGMHFFLTIGVNLSLHRFYSHQSFKTSRIFAFVLAVWGWLGGHRSPLFWAGVHKKHHYYCETPLDPHSPSKGFEYSHYMWLLDPQVMRLHWGWMPRTLKHRPELLVLELFGALAYFITPCLVSCLCGGGWTPFITSWCAICTHLNVEGAVNSLCHLPCLQTDDKSCRAIDSYVLGFFTGGDGFHAKHHDMARCARHAPASYLDMVYLLICGMEKVGLVWDVAHPTKSDR